MVPENKEGASSVIAAAVPTDEERVLFDFLYERYKRILYKKAFDILHDPMLAEDAVSEAYMRIYRNISKLTGLDPPQRTVYIVTVLKNVSYTLLKKKIRSQADELDESWPDSSDLESQVIAQMSAQEIYDTVGELGEELKTLFLLRYGYDLPTGEIAREVGSTTNQVSLRLHRARKKLADILSKEGKHGKH